MWEGGVFTLHLMIIQVLAHSFYLETCAVQGNHGLCTCASGHAYFSMSVRGPDNSLKCGIHYFKHVILSLQGVIDSAYNHFLPISIGLNVARPGCLFSLSARPVRAGMKRYTTFPLINSDAYFYVFSVARFYV